MSGQEALIAMLGRSHPIKESGNQKEGMSHYVRDVICFLSDICSGSLRAISQTYITSLCLNFILKNNFGYYCHTLIKTHKKRTHFYQLWCNCQISSFV